MQQGYYRKPTLSGDRVAFVSEDDLWTVSAEGGVARRLTANPGRASDPWYSPDGQWIAYTSRDEGPFEVHVMASEGGPNQRLTYLGANTVVAGWTPDSATVLYATTAAQPYRQRPALGLVPREGGSAAPLPWGPAAALSYGPGGGLVLGRFTSDPARWKRYRGGTVGQLWVDAEGSGEFRPLIDLKGNVTRPLWVGERIWFGSDHEGVCNLYSCLPDGSDLRRHTHHDDFYVRFPSSDGRRIVYQCGADLYLFDPAADAARKIEVEYHSPRVFRQRRFVRAQDYLEDFDPHPEGHHLLTTVRGRPYSFANWEQGVLPHGEEDGVRYRLARWLDDERFVCLSDRSGEERLEVHRVDGSEEPVVVGPDFDLGRPTLMEVAPTGGLVALANHRHELLVADPEKGEVHVVERSPYDRIAGVAWSPDGRWLAYSFAETQQTLSLKLCRAEDREVFRVTRPQFRDLAPSFDPEGRYLYFLSYREFDPVYDSLYFDLNFPRGMRPYLVTLRADLPSPFIPEPRSLAEGNGKKKGRKEKADEAVPADGETPSEEGEEKEKPAEADAPPAEGPKPVEIDLEGLEDRVVAFPVGEGRYGQVDGLADQVLFTSFPVEGSLQGGSWPPPKEPPAKGTLMTWEFKTSERKDLIPKVTHFRLSRDLKTLVYRAGNRLRAVAAGKKPDDKAEGGASRKTGWIDLSRVRPSVLPPEEWRQMYREAWRLMRDQFWSEDMSGVDWQEVYRQYLPLLERVGARSEFSDLLWEVQGELGTSHAYEMGGDYQPEPDYTLGQLGADLEYHEETDDYVVRRLVRGDSWNPWHDSPLHRPGVDVRPGDRIAAVNGRKVGRETSPAELLVHQAGLEVQLTVLRGEEEPRRIFVRTLRDESMARYRQWVAENRRQVHERSGGRVGYVHIPNMGPLGFSEFHRSYLSEVDREGLVVDVRFNGGGHVSPLLLEKLARRRVGYDVQRWGAPVPYPQDSPRGPMVALTNESAGSDGDIFSHVFKLMKLGPLVGKRTWGGVIGIWPRHRLVDGTITTQPEFAFWFEDVGWGVENYGTDPDVVVEYPPQAYAAGEDPQLQRALDLVMAEIESNPPTLPKWSERPHRGRPRLGP